MGRVSRDGRTEAVHDCDVADLEDQHHARWNWHAVMEDGGKSWRLDGSLKNVLFLCVAVSEL